MKREDVELIISALEGERRLIHYFKDRYAVELLRQYVGAGRPLDDVRSSRFGRLLHKPVIRGALAQCGGGVLQSDKLDMVWPIDPIAFRITLDMWGAESHTKDWRWRQTSRCGKNLVVQVNFCGQHNAIYRSQVDNSGNGPFEFGCHPIRDNEYTLAWARVDMDLDKGVALIEEIQSDWIREVRDCKVSRDEHGDNELFVNWIKVTGSTEDSVAAYRRFALDTYGPIWAELTLWATLDMLVRELGVTTVYYHEWKSGAALKSIGGRLPPRSLYTDLPRRFCFTETQAIPRFLRDRRNRRRLKAIKPIFQVFKPF